jgi:signal recognition particle subunit SRP72
MNRDQNIFDSKKRIKAATAEGLEHKLTSAQRAQIARNQALLAMFTAQVDLCKQLVDQLEEGTVPDKELIIAGVLAKAGKHESAAEILLSGKEDPTRVLAAAQAAFCNRNP